MTDRPLPLHGIRVLELAQIVAGPFCSTLMAEFGAEVIKTELPGKGDDLRRLGPTEDGLNYWYAIDNRGKKVVTLDLRTKKGQDLVRRLVPLCDVVIENFRPGVLESWGLGWEDLRTLRPSLIMARITAFGQTGPLRNGPGFAAIASAFGGTWYLNGPADRPPSRPTPARGSPWEAGSHIWSSPRPATSGPWRPPSCPGASPTPAVSPRLGTETPR